MNLLIKVLRHHEFTSRCLHRVNAAPPFGVACQRLNSTVLRDLPEGYHVFIQNAGNQRVSK